ncbi:MAG: MAPEG family protein [Pseudomonadota bacterium]
MHSPILAPVVAMVAWTIVMWLWMYARRIPAMRAAGIDAATKVGGTGADLRAVLPDRVQWIADNYNHLHEQPTIFYAIAIVHALLGTGFGFNLWLAWGYVALRVAHSLVQSINNRVIVRFSLFALAELCLIALTLHAAMALF